MPKTTKPGEAPVVDDPVVDMVHPRGGRQGVYASDTGTLRALEREGWVPSDKLDPKKVDIIPLKQTRYAKRRAERKHGKPVEPPKKPAAKPAKAPSP